MIIRKNKKMQIATTMNWFVAFLIIFFVMIIFLISVTAIRVTGERKFVASFDSGYFSYHWDKNVFDSLVAFMNTEMEYKGQSLDIYTLIPLVVAEEKSGGSGTSIKAEITEKAKSVFYFAFGGWAWQFSVFQKGREASIIATPPLGAGYDVERITDKNEEYSFILVANSYSGRTA